MMRQSGVVELGEGAWRRPQWERKQTFRDPRLTFYPAMDSPLTDACESGVCEPEFSSLLSLPTDAKNRNTPLTSGLPPEKWSSLN
jgi:hypothetical protein